MSSKPIVEGVKLQGILANGYGIMPQAVSRNKKLTPEAKAIYAYLTAFSGASFKPIFPSRELMLEELNMSINRFYKHMQLLLDSNLVTVERSMDGNIFGKNIYSLVLVPEIAKETVRVRKPAKISKRLDRKKAPESLPAKEEQMKVPEELPERITAAAPDPDLPAKAPATAGNRLAAQLGIQVILEKRPEHKDLIEYIFMTIEDMATSEQITVNGSVKKKDAIKRLTENLRMEHIEALVNNISQSGQTIMRKKAYILSCIWNIFFDMTGPLDFSKKKFIMQEEENPEQSGSAKMKDLYKRNPELKDLDDQIFALGSKISKAILSGNELQTKALQIEKGKLNERREEMLLQMNETSSV